MRFICLLLMVVLGNVKGDGQVWLKDLISPKGWDLGYGVVLRVNESNNGKEVPLTERLSLDINLGDLVGVSVGKRKSDGIELDFYVKKTDNYQEGRGKKNEENSKYMIPMVLGYKSAILLTGMFGLIKLLTIKAMFLAKIALLISLYVLLLKFKQHQPAQIFEVEQLELPVHPPIHIPAKGYGGSSFHDFGPVGSYGGGNSGGTVGGGGGNYGHSYGNEAQGSDTYQDMVYAPSTQGTGVSESNSPYIPVINNNDQGNVVRNVERDNPYFDKTLGVNSGNGLITDQKYISPES